MKNLLLCFLVVLLGTLAGKACADERWVEIDRTNQLDLASVKRDGRMMHFWSKQTQASGVYVMAYGRTTCGGKYQVLQVEKYAADGTHLATGVVDTPFMPPPGSIAKTIQDRLCQQTKASLL